VNTTISKAAGSFHREPSRSAARFGACFREGKSALIRKLDEQQSNRVTKRKELLRLHCLTGEAKSNISRSNANTAFPNFVSWFLVCSTAVSRISRLPCGFPMPDFGRFGAAINSSKNRLHWGGHLIFSPLRFVPKIKRTA
jgi:hypothetical protein